LFYSPDCDYPVPTRKSQCFDHRTPYPGSANNSSEKGVKQKEDEEETRNTADTKLKGRKQKREKKRIRLKRRKGGNRAHRKEKRGEAEFKETCFPIRTKQR